MRDYGKVHTRFWLSPETLTWSDDAKLLYLYLLSSPHCNLLGCFRLPLGYLSEDLQWQPERLLAALAELSEAKRIIRCQPSGWTFLCDFLTQNPIENPNQGKAAWRLLADVPAEFIGMQALQNALAPYRHRLPDAAPAGVSSSIPEKASSQSRVRPIDKKPPLKPVKSTVNSANSTPNIEGNSSNFDDFWGLQTRKEKKGAAQSQWIKLGLHKDPSKALLVINAWKIQRQTRLQYQTLQLTPLPCNWLENEQWQDEYEKVDLVQATNNGIEYLPATDENQSVAQQWAGNQ